MTRLTFRGETYRLLPEDAMPRDPFFDGRCVYFAIPHQTYLTLVDDLMGDEYVVLTVRLRRENPFTQKLHATKPLYFVCKHAGNMCFDVDDSAEDLVNIRLELPRQNEVTEPVERLLKLYLLLDEPA